MTRSVFAEHHDVTVKLTFTSKYLFYLSLNNERLNSWYITFTKMLRDSDLWPFQCQKKNNKSEIIPSKWPWFTILKSPEAYVSWDDSDLDLWPLTTFRLLPCFHFLLVFTLMSVSWILSSVCSFRYMLMYVIVHNNCSTKKIINASDQDFVFWKLCCCSFTVEVIFWAQVIIFKWS